jgi:hypothetical protein
LRAYNGMDGRLQSLLSIRKHRSPKAFQLEPAITIAIDAITGHWRHLARTNKWFEGYDLFPTADYGCFWHGVVKQLRLVWNRKWGGWFVAVWNARFATTGIGRVSSPCPQIFTKEIRLSY